MSNVDLVAIKPFSYANKRREVGDRFTASVSDARLLIAIRKAAKAGAERPAAALPPPPADLADKIARFDHDHRGGPGGSAAPPADADLPFLRRQYFETLGKRPFNGWDAETLRDKIATARLA